MFNDIFLKCKKEADDEKEFMRISDQSKQEKVKKHKKKLKKLTKVAQEAATGNDPIASSRADDAVVALVGPLLVRVH